MLKDKNDRANIVYWSSTKCKRVTRSVLASKLYTISNGFDIAVVVKATIKQILKIDLLLTIYTNSKSLYNYIIKLRTT